MILVLHRDFLHCRFEVSDEFLQLLIDSQATRNFNVQQVIVGRNTLHCETTQEKKKEINKVKGINLMINLKPNHQNTPKVTFVPAYKLMSSL